MDNKKTPIERAYYLFGSQSSLAALLGVSAPTVNQWVKSTRPIPPEHCTTIERVTKGAVTRQELRPNDFWRIWPDLTQPSTTEPVPLDGIDLDHSDQERRDRERREAERREDERRNQQGPGANSTTVD